jgi:hypothetical protein
VWWRRLRRARSGLSVLMLDAPMKQRGCRTCGRFAAGHVLCNQDARTTRGLAASESALLTYYHDDGARAQTLELPIIETATPFSERRTRLPLLHRHVLS